jgi:hypothetical protein
MTPSPSDPTTIGDVSMSVEATLSAPEAITEVKRLAVRLIDDYDFACIAGSLDQCVDWQRMISLLGLIFTAAEDMATDVAADADTIARLREQVTILEALHVDHRRARDDLGQANGRLLTRAVAAEAELSFLKAAGTRADGIEAMRSTLVRSMSVTAGASRAMASGAHQRGDLASEKEHADEATAWAAAIELVNVTAASIRALSPASPKPVVGEKPYNSHERQMDAE